MVQIRSFAKLNLTFEILGLLPDGFHEIRTVFQSIDLADSLTFELSETLSAEPFQVELTEIGDALPRAASAEFPLNDTNLIVRAAKKFEAFTGCGAGYKLHVKIDKQIPIAAGLAGGSSNAAAALLAMQKLFGNDCQPAHADEVASQLGSDINFCLHGGTQLGTNRGEMLQPVQSPPQFHFILLKPRAVAIATPWIYRQYDESLKESHDLSAAPSRNYAQECTEAMVQDDWQKLPGTLFNAFEQVCFAHYPTVRDLRNLMLDCGCLSANITGSGPTLFGLVHSSAQGHEVREKLLRRAASQSKATEFDCWLVQSTTAGLAIQESPA